jgi:hypothetical protein
MLGKRVEFGANNKNRIAKVCEAKRDEEKFKELGVLKCTD